MCNFFPLIIFPALNIINHFSQSQNAISASEGLGEAA